MKFLVLLALIVSLAAITRGQTVKEPVLIDSFGLAPNGDFKGRADLFMHELSTNPEDRGLIVIYGTPGQIGARQRLIRSHFSTRRFPLSRLDLKVGGNVSVFRTEFWRVPPGSTQPELKPEAWIFKDIGRANKSILTRAMSDLDKEAQKLRDHQSYIINYGTPSQVAQRERWIRDGIPSRRFDALRITLVNGGNSGTPRTVMWLVPPGGENPKP